MPDFESPRRTATIRDVAELARVSTQTVSNVLNGRTAGMMTGATRQRVVDAIDQLEFRPNPNAVRLRNGLARTIAFSILDPSSRFLADAFTAEMLAGAAESARRHDYHLLLEAVRPSSPDIGVQVAAPLLFQQADGLLVLPSGTRNSLVRALGAAVRTGKPVVVLSAAAPEFDGVGSVAADDVQAGFLVGEHLASLGHSRAAFVQSKVAWPAIRARLFGVREAFRVANCAPLQLVTASGWTVEAGRTALAAVLARPPGERPTAIIAGNDVLAAGAMMAAREAGFSVPSEVSIAGFDDLDFARALEPALTTVRVNGMEIGRAAARDLLLRIETPRLPARTRVLPTTLVVRASTALAVA